MISLHAICKGEGRPVILLHGLASSLQNWQSQTIALSKAGYCAHAVDLPGHGESPSPAAVDFYNAETFSSVVKSWIQDLDLQQPPVLIGHSLGGYLSLRYALSHPRTVKGLVLIAPLYSPHQIYQPLRLLRKRPELGEEVLRLTPEEWINAVYKKLPTRIAGFPPEQRQQIVKDYKRCSPLVMHLPATLEDLTPLLPTLGLPVQVIWGTNDLTLRPASFERLVKSLPNAVGHPIRRCGHQPHVSQAEQVNQLLLAFLQTL